jgi:hypothetical protein
VSEEFDHVSEESGVFRMTRNGFRVRIAFDVPDDGENAPCILNYRDQLLQLIALSECSQVTFDMTGISSPPGGLVGLLASAQDCGCEVELLNPSSEVQEILRIANVDSQLLIRGTTA